MENSAILKVVLGVVRNVLDDEDIDFDESVSIRDVPDWDSLNNMHIVVRIEKKLGLDFRQEDFDGVETVGQLVSLIASRLPQ
jgi:acyl carrier protein